MWGRTKTMIDIVKTKIATDIILEQIKSVWGNETGRPMDEYRVCEWNTWQNNNNRVVFIGGDHTVTASTFPKIKTEQLVILDAHFDLYGNSEKLHHGNWLKWLIEKGTIDPQKIVLLGVRSWDKTELEYASNKGIRFIPFDRPSFLDFSDKPTYLSIDIDVVDPAFAPGTKYMEPGGWLSRSILEVVKILRPSLVAMDIVEIDASKDFNNMTSKLAAKIIKEFL